MSPSRSPPDMRSVAGRLPRVENTMQSTRCESSGFSTTRNFCKSPGCKHGFRVTSTSIPLNARGMPSPSMVTLTAHSPSFKTSQASQIPNNSLEFGIRIRHFCSPLLFSIVLYSLLMSFVIFGFTASKDSSKSSAIFGSFTYVRKRNPERGSTQALSRNSRCSACFRKRTFSEIPSA